MIIRPQRRCQGFTLIEIIIVVMLIGMIMAWGVPTFVQTFKRQPLQQTVHDLMEACAAARAAAILTGQPAELVFLGDRTFTVRSSAGAPVESADGQTAGGQVSGRLADGLDLEMLHVNLIDMREAEVSEVPVKFYPNGTCEEFTISLVEPATGKRRMIRLDVITGHADLKTEDGIAALKK